MTKLFFVKFVLKITTPFLYLLAKMDANGVRSLSYIIRIFEKRANNYITFKLRPKKSDSFISSRIRTNVHTGEFAIVLQGPIELRDDFTLESVRFYRKMFPKCIIIISTWDNVDETFLERFRKENCYIVLSSFFKGGGCGNVNYQICTSLAGIKKAKELGALYTLKCRSDLRIYREFVLEYLKSLVEMFPVPEPNLFGLKGRIISQSGGWGQLFMPYTLQDFIYFGYTDDLLNFFDIPYDKREIGPIQNHLKSIHKVTTGRYVYDLLPPELYLTKSFIEKYDKTPHTVKTFWELFSKFFMTVDQDQIGSLWNKYGLHFTSAYYCEFDGKHNYKDSMKHISFIDTINLINNQYIYEDWMENEMDNYIVFK